MKKKIGFAALLTAILMCLGITISFAATNETAVAELLGKMSVMTGYPDGSLQLEKSVTRGEFSKITVMVSPYKNQVASGLRVSPFPDVTYKHWAAPYVKLAVSGGLIKGYPDSTFRPDETVLLEEAVTVYLRLLGYPDNDFASSWPFGQLGMAENIGLLDDVTANAGQPLTRRDVMQLTYNLLTASPKNSQGKYLQTIEYSLVEDVVLIATSREDSSVPVDSVSTSGGTFKIDNGFNRAQLGMRGDVILKSGNTVLSFIPYGDDFETHVVYACLENAIVTYENGVMQQVALQGGTRCYMGTKSSTYAASSSAIEMGDLLSVKKDDNGQVEYITVLEGNMKGPVVVYDNSWIQSLAVSGDIAVVRDGVKGTADDIKTYDVVYYSSDLNMVLAYSKKVTGIYETALPNKEQLTQITVSGVTYKVDSADAFRALSSSGQYAYGDTITLLFGKNDAVAGVVSGQTSAKSVVGFFEEAGKKQYKNQAGDTYSNFYVQVIGPDGQRHQYATGKDFSESPSLGQVVRVSLSGGLASVAAVTPRTLSGKVDSENRLIGEYRVAENAEILDVIFTNGNHNGTAVPVFLQEMEGVYLNSTNVVYYSTNSAGEIEELIVKDATGSCYQYGIVTYAKTLDVGMNVSGNYRYDIGGKELQTATSGSAFNVGTGQPVKILSVGGRVYSMEPLEKVAATITEVKTDRLVETYGEEYLLSAGVVAYKKTDYDYMVMALSDLDPEKYNIEAYCDRPIQYGGKIRVIIAREK